MPKPKGKRAGGKGRRPARAKVAKKVAKKGRRPRAKGAKPAARRGRAVAPKKRAQAPAKPAPPAARPAAPAPKAAPPAPKTGPPVIKPAPLAAKPVAPVAPAGESKPAPSVAKGKEATRMSEGTKCPIHGVPDCFKPALDAYVQKAYDGYCTKIDWPFVRIIPKGWTPGK